MSLFLLAEQAVVRDKVEATEVPEAVEPEQQFERLYIWTLTKRSLSAVEVREREVVEQEPKAHSVPLEQTF
jgi:hypothetical protein